jgi:peptide/nickel transport system substrate-binding protein
MKRLLLGSMTFLLVAGVWSEQGSGQPMTAPRGEIRIVDTHPWNWIYVTLNVFEHLMEIDKDGKLVPRLATDWQWVDERTLEVTLRQGVTFHNGEKFDADIVKLNWEENIRTRQPHILGGFMNFASGSRLDIINPYQVRFVFPEPDGGALAKLSFMHIGNRQFYRELGWGEKHW